MIITKKDIRDITKDNFMTNRVARAILICARSKPLMYAEFLQMGALVTLRRRVLHNSMTDNDKEIIALAEWAIDEYGLPEVEDAGTSEALGRAACADGTEPRDAASKFRQTTSGEVH